MRSLTLLSGRPKFYILEHAGNRPIKESNRNPSINRFNNRQGQFLRFPTTRCSREYGADGGGIPGSKKSSCCHRESRDPMGAYPHQEGATETQPMTRAAIRLRMTSNIYCRSRPSPTYLQLLRLFSAGSPPSSRCAGQSANL